MTPKSRHFFRVGEDEIFLNFSPIRKSVKAFCGWLCWRSASKDNKMTIMPFSGSQLLDVLTNRTITSRIIDYTILESLHDDLLPFVEKLERNEASWMNFEMFWPPRAVDAYSSGNLIPFFGAGLSAAANMPMWGDLLQAYFEPSDAFNSDEDLDQDFLTKAELAAQRVGANRIQSRLREECARHTIPTASHLMLATLRSPIMITTNYDWLLEEAWQIVNPRVELDVAVNDTDLSNFQNWQSYSYGGDRALLLKIHGCAKRGSEQLVLTRADYRYHYRTNDQFFRNVAEIFANRHIVFLGFSHRDPEVARLVDDSIYEYEQALKQAIRTGSALPTNRPHLYSMQFDMRRHTPEIFAAKGLVALTPPLVDSDPDASKSASVCRALADLILFSAFNSHHDASLENSLDSAITRISQDINHALDTLKDYKTDALEIVAGRTPSSPLSNIINTLSVLASQGVYVLNERGECVEFAVPNGLDHAARNAIREFHTRPYFRIAKSFREEFVSDSICSIYNDLSTVFFCMPLFDTRGFAGLLFAASQVGTWYTPVDVADQCWSSGFSLIMVDSEGVLLLPPNNEISMVTDCTGPTGNEDPNSNKGYNFNRLLSFSRRDRVARHIANNIVPISQDDDIHRLSADVDYYSVVSVVPRTRWKLAVSRPIYK